VPVSVIFVAQLHIRAVNAWLARRVGGEVIEVADRPLRACLVARYGQGFIFADANDPEDELRFSFAHELAHFLYEYWTPRERVRNRLGEEAVTVIDGHRESTQQERIRAALMHVDLEPRIHLMERTPDGHIADVTIDDAEHVADWLAFELLAPAATVIEALDGYPGSERPAAACCLLVEQFGLPEALAIRYARLLFPAPPRPSPLFRRLIAEA
jgi:hypothetical protein